MSTLPAGPRVEPISRQKEAGPGDLVRTAGQPVGAWTDASRFAEPLQKAARRVHPGLLAFFLIVLAPTITAGLYLGLFATKRYASEFRVSVRSIEPMKGNINGLGALIGLTRRLPIVVQFACDRAISRKPTGL